VKRRELSWFQLRFPRDLSEPSLVAALSSLSGLPAGSRLVFELTATAAGIEHRLAVTETTREAVTANLRAAIPSLRLESVVGPTASLRPQWLWQLSAPVAALRTSEASAGLLAGLFPLRSGETVQLRWQLRPGPRPTFDFGSEGSRAGRTLAIRQKLALAGLHGYGELAVEARTQARRRQLTQRVSTSLRALSTPHGRLVADPPWLGRLAYFFAQRGRYFSASELVTVLGWPLDGIDQPGLELGASKRLVPSRDLPREGRLLGVSDYGEGARPVAITATASTRGLYILGPTGSGKTALIKNLVRDDLHAGRGLAVVETNGDLIQDLLDLIPAERVSDVVFIDPTDREFAVGFNPLVGSADPSLVADQLVELFRNLWQAYWGPRTGQLAHMGLLTLARRSGSTLLDLPRLFLDPAFRATVLAGLDDPVGLEPDWRWFQTLPEKEQATVVSPLLNKSRQFTARDAIRSIVGQPQPTVSMRSVMAERRILLGPSAEGAHRSRDGPTTRLLGADLAMAGDHRTSSAVAQPASAFQPVRRRGGGLRERPDSVGRDVRSRAQVRP
jgi:hypothetical protein